MNFDDYYQGRPSSSLLNRTADDRQQLPRPLTPPINLSRKLNRFHKNISLQSGRGSLLANGKVDHSEVLGVLKQEATSHHYSSATNLTAAGVTPDNNIADEGDGDINTNNNGDGWRVGSGSRSNMILDSTRIGLYSPASRNRQQQSPAPATSHSIANNGNDYYQRQHLSQYSSSQAQLQSMTNGPSFVNYTSDTFARKTPKSSHQQNRGNNRSQISFATTTKPMTSMLNEPEVLFQPNTTTTSSQQQNRWIQLNASALHQQRSSSISGGSHPVGLAGTSASTGTLNVPATSTSSVNANHPLPPPYSAIQGGHQLLPAQNVICHQPTNGQQVASAAIGAFAGAELQHQQQQHVQAGGNRFPSSNDITGNLPNNTPQRNNPTHQVQSSATSSTTMVNQFGVVQQNVGATGTSSNNFTITSQQQYPFLHNHHHHHPHIAHNMNGQEAAAIAAAALTNSCLHLTNGVGSTKKSCLTCADISIKWYIVVIALLGLICALIGTIVGAVHSAGRDYISLTLLLIGVGLVLVAISWVALRITIKTYKTSPAAAPILPTGRGASAQSLPTLQPSRRAANSTGAFPAPPLRRLLATSGSSGSSNAALNHRSALLNERLYMIAAAAAAMSRPPQQTTGNAGPSSEQPTTSLPTPQAATPDSNHANRMRSMVNSIKERLPRSLARLMSQQTGGPSTSGPANRRNNPTGELPETAAAALALLHQYQQQMQHQSAFLFPGGVSAVPHLSFGASLADFANYRPPPPSYSASMQDQRWRLLMQERANIQQLQQMSMFPSANLPPPPPPPPSLASTNHNAQITVGSANDAANEQIPRATNSALSFHSIDSGRERVRGPGQLRDSESVIIQNCQSPSAQHEPEIPRARAINRAAGMARRMSLSSLTPPTSGMVENAPDGSSTYHKGSIAAAETKTVASAGLKSSGSAPMIAPDESFVNNNDIYVSSGEVEVAPNHCANRSREQQTTIVNIVKQQQQLSSSNEGLKVAGELRAKDDTARLSSEPQKRQPT